MTALVQRILSREKSQSWTLSSSQSEVFQFSDQEVLKIFIQPVSNVMQGMCRLETGFEKLMPLFKGLLGMGKPATLSVIFDLNQSQIFFTYSLGEKREVERFLNRIISLVKGEARFKQILQKVLDNKRKFQAEQSLLQSALNTVNWD